MLWRKRPYCHISTDWVVSEATICRTVHRVEDCRMQSGKFRLSVKKRLFKGFDPRPDVVVMHMTETPIERPQRKQKCFYSGKNRQHTLKCQIILAPKPVKSFVPSLAKAGVMILRCSRHRRCGAIPRRAVYKTVAIRAWTATMPTVRSPKRNSERACYPHPISNIIGS